MLLNLGLQHVQAIKQPPGVVQLLISSGCTAMLTGSSSRRLQAVPTACAQSEVRSMYSSMSFGAYHSMNYCLALCVLPAIAWCELRRCAWSCIVVFGSLELLGRSARCT